MAVIVSTVMFGLIVALGGNTVANAQPPPGGCAVQPSTATAPAAQKTATLNADQMAAARTIVAVGKGMGITQRGTAIGLGTAMAESSLNTGATNGRYVGLFQQQGEPYADITRADAASASRGFYRELLRVVPNYDKDSTYGGVAFGVAAQAVERSDKDASFYAPWETWALALAAQLYTGTPAQGGGGDATVTCTPGGGHGPVHVKVDGLKVDVPDGTLVNKQPVHGTFTFPNDRTAAAAAAAMSYLGTTYAWGGGGPNGPTKGIHDGGIADKYGDYAKIGFDCSGLTLYAYAQAGIALARTADPQLTTARTTAPYSQVKPGDLLFWGAPAHHVALYLGQLNGTPYMVESPQSGDQVMISVVRDRDSDFRSVVARPAP
ncbi:C40 family peptidase [Kutzneria sp. 744]|uniref:C40 family peptidase n=1 Tax=Kutzneria sp. (strain 744) TaxID=345341 RepID=UPI0003EEDE95|nr:C40 family peptidase [Kutzneria sp. 744]EWM19741.1 NLP/P60 family protein [Kutzneria sp. 744]